MKINQGLLKQENRRHKSPCISTWFLDELYYLISAEFKKQIFPQNIQNLLTVVKTRAGRGKREVTEFSSEQEYSMNEKQEKLILPVLLIKVNEEAGMWDIQPGAKKPLQLGRLSMQAAKHGPARQQSSPQHSCSSICYSFWCIKNFLV